MPAGTDEIQIIPGNQSTLDLRDLTVGVSYGVSVTALVGENEGDPVTVYIKPGETSSDIRCCCVLFCSSTFLVLFCFFPFICQYQCQCQYHVSNAVQHILCIDKCYMWIIIQHIVYFLNI